MWLVSDNCWKMDRCGSSALSNPASFSPWPYDVPEWNEALFGFVGYICSTFQLVFLFFHFFLIFDANVMKI